MKNYKDSDFAINKYNQGIVYKFTKEFVVITLEKFLEDNPCNTAEQFMKLKAISDEIYLQQVTDENTQTAKNIAISANIATPSPEDLIFDIVNAEEDQKINRDKLKAIFSSLSPTQRKRLYLHRIKKLTTREIAVMEEVSQRTIEDSLQ